MLFLVHCIVKKCWPLITNGLDEVNALIDLSELNLKSGVYFFYHFINLTPSIGGTMITIIVGSIIASAINRDSEIDRIIILKYVLRAKLFIVCIFLIYLPLFFDSTGTYRIILFLICLTGIIGLFVIIKNIYHWFNDINSPDNIDSYRNTLVRKFFNDSKNFKIKKFAWEIILNNKIHTPNSKRFYIGKVLEDMKFLQNKKDFANLSFLIDKIYENLDSENFTDWVVIAEITKNLLERLYTSYHGMNDQYNKLNFYQHECNEKFIRLFANLFTKAINTGYTEPFFIELNNYFSNTIKNISEFEKFFLKNIFLGSLFNQIQFFKNYGETFEHYFPGKWKITIHNLKENKDFTNLVIFRSYLLWLINKLTINNEYEFDFNIDRITCHLFPEADPITLSKILTLIVYINTGIENLFEKPRIFGIVGRIHISDWEEGQANHIKRFKKQSELEYNNTIQLLNEVLPNYFNVKFIDYALDKISQVSYPENSKEKAKQNSYLEILNDIKTFLTINQFPS